MFFLSCVCYAFVCICLYVPCGHLLGKGWPLGSRLWCPTVSLSLSHCYPGSGVVLDCIDSWSLHLYLLWTSTKQRIKCLAQGQNTVPLVSLEPVTLQSQIQHSTTELLHSSRWHVNFVAGFGPRCLLLYLNRQVMLDNYLQQTTSADDIFRCIFFLAL